MEACSYPIRPKRVSYKKSNDLFSHGAIKINIRQKSAEIERTITLGPVALGYRRASAIDGRQTMIVSNNGRADNTRRIAHLGAFIFRPEIWVIYTFEWRGTTALACALYVSRRQ